MAGVKTITDDNYAAETENGIVVVDFWATWCAPCRMQATILEKMAAKMEGIQFCTINSDENPSVSLDLGVSALPTLAIYKNGELVDRITGLLSEARLRSRIEQQM